MTSMLKKTALSFIAICVFGTYAWYEHMHSDSADLFSLIASDLAGAKPVVSAETTSDTTQTTANGMTPEEYAQYIAQINAAAKSQAQAQQQAKAPTTAIRTRRSRGEDEEFEDDGESQVISESTPVPMPPPAPTPTPVPQPTPPPTPAPTPTPAPVAQTSGRYRDGIYTGSNADAFYGYVQVQAVVRGGKLTDVKFLSYPNDRNTSRYINSQAMPILIQEALQAQSAQVDGVSGATDTSQAFIESLSAALAQA